MELNFLDVPVLLNSNAPLKFTCDDFEALSCQEEPLILHTVGSADGNLVLSVDHSYFTGRHTKYVFSDEANPPIQAILNSIQEMIITLQNDVMRKLATVNAATINSLEASEIVHNVLREVMNILTHSDAGVFRLYDASTDLLEPVSHEGMPEGYRYYRVKPNESVSGEVFSTGIPALINGRGNILSAPRAMRPENKSFMDRSPIANSLLCVPVVANGKILGTLTTLCFSNDGLFSPFDRVILETMATQVAAAYQKSLAYKSALSTANNLEVMRNDLLRKNQELDRTVSLHDTIMNIFSTHEDVLKQLEEISIQFGVSFKYSNLLGMDYQSSSWIDGDCLTQPVSVAKLSIGRLDYRPHTDTSYFRALFTTVATFLALEFVRNTSRIDVLNAEKKALFDLLSSNSASHAGKSIDGFRSDRFNQIYVIIIPGDNKAESMSLGSYELLSEIQSRMAEFNSLIFCDADTIICLVSTSKAASLDRATDIILRAAESLSLHVGASDAYEDHAQNGSERENATQAARAMLRQSRAGLLRHCDMGVEFLLLGKSRGEVIGFTQRILKPLFDNSRNRQLYETLATYIRCGKSASATAHTLNIHVNTLYQRLQRIEDLTGRSLSDASDFTLLSLACNLSQKYT